MTRMNNEFRFDGNVGTAPEIRFNPNSGKPIAEISLAVDMSYKDPQSGQHVEVTDWMPITFYNESLIEKVIKIYVKSGTEISVKGEVRKRVKHDDDSLGDGKKPRWFEFVGTNIRLHGGPKAVDAGATSLDTSNPEDQEAAAREPSLA